MVEVRGVEPRSEEKTLKTSTYIAGLFVFTCGNSGAAFTASRYAGPTGLATCYPKCSRLRRASLTPLRTECALAHLSRRSIRPQWARTERNGLPNYLGSQCVVVVGT